MLLEEILPETRKGRKCRPADHYHFRELSAWMRPLHTKHLMEDTWELEHEPEVIRLSSATTVTREPGGWTLREYDPPKEFALLDVELASLAALYAASKGEVEYVEPSVNEIKDAVGSHYFRVVAYKRGHKAGWDAGREAL